LKYSRQQASGRLSGFLQFQGGRDSVPVASRQDGDCLEFARFPARNGAADFRAGFTPAGTTGIIFCFLNTT
jgi:hypothetical protein